MRALEPNGHKYELESFDTEHNALPPVVQYIEFIYKEPDPEGAGELKTLRNGTTNEEVLRVLIHRMNFLQNKFPCKENACAITHMEEALMWLEKRTRDREARGVEGKHEK